MKYITIIIAVILLKSCGSSKDLASNTNDMASNDSLSGIFTLNMLDTESVTDALTLEFDETTNKVSGFSGCNRFFGTYKTDGNSIMFSQMGSTKKYCQDEANNIEQKFLKALSKVNMFSLQDNNLSLQVDKEMVIAASQNASSRMMQDSMKINYRAATRGFYLQIWIEGDSIKYTSDYNLKDISTHQIPTDEKEDLMKLLNDIDVKTLPEIESTSSKFQFDGAPMATLEIINGENSYKTVGFDHGNSPKSIALIIDKILSIKTMLEKQ